MRLGIKAAILQQRTSQRELSRSTNIPENRLSTIICGWVEPTSAERAKLASALLQSEAALFDENASIEIVCSPSAAAPDEDDVA